MAVVGEAATRTLKRPATMLKVKWVHFSNDIRGMRFPETGDRLMGIWLKLVKSKVSMGCIQFVDRGRA